MSIYQRLEAGANKAIIQAARRAIDLMYSESQRLCPVGKSQNLRRSGRKQYTRYGGNVSYNAPYAHAEEEGFKAHTQNVRAYYRKQNFRTTHQRGRIGVVTSTVNVRAHKRHMPERKGVFFLATARELAIKKLPEFIAEELKKGLR